MKKNISVLLCLTILMSLVILFASLQSASAVCSHAWKTVSSSTSTCTVQGRIIQECTKCSVRKHTLRPLLAHTQVTATTVKPTCTSTGTSRTYCSRCNKTFSTTTLPKLSHDYYNYTNHLGQVPCGSRQQTCSSLSTLHTHTQFKWTNEYRRACYNCNYDVLLSTSPVYEWWCDLG